MTTTKDHCGPRPTPIRLQARGLIHQQEGSPELRAVHDAVRAQDAQFQAAADGLRGFAGNATLSVSPSALRAIADAAEERPLCSPLA
jgi:hypothetical protein